MGIIGSLFELGDLFDEGLGDETSSSSAPPSSSSTSTTQSTPKSFSTVYGQERDNLHLFLNDSYGFTVSQTNNFVNGLAASKGYTAAWQFFQDPDFFAGAERFVNSANLLPPMFYGLEDGQLYLNNLETGPYPVAQFTPSDDRPGSKSLDRFTPVIPNEKASFLGFDDRGLSRFGPQPLDSLGFRRPKKDIPSLSLTDVFGFLGRDQSGGSGSGSSGRLDPVFDREHILESIREAWKGLLLEEPDNLDALTTEFIENATAFSRLGGQRNLGTWVLNKAKPTARYKLIYQRKPDSLNENQYLGQFVQSANQFGMRAEQTTSAAVRGASQGVSQAGFQEGLSKSVPVRRQGQGKFSRRFAEQLAGLGPMGRS